MSNPFDLALPPGVSAVDFLAHLNKPEHYDPASPQLSDFNDESGEEGRENDDGDDDDEEEEDEDDYEEDDDEDDDDDDDDDYDDDYEDEGDEGSKGHKSHDDGGKRDLDPFRDFRPPIATSAASFLGEGVMLTSQQQSLLPGMRRGSLPT